MIDFSALRLSVGLSLLSMPMISNFTPAGLLALNFSAKNWKVFSWFVPTWAIRPDNGSIHAILTVWPASGLPDLSATFVAALVCATARPADSEKPLASAMQRAMLERFIGLFPAALTVINSTGSGVAKGSGMTPNGYVASETAKVFQPVGSLWFLNCSRSLSFWILPVAGYVI